MISKAIQQHLTSLVGPLTSISKFDSGAQELMIRGMNAALGIGVTPFSGKHRAQYARIVGEDRSAKPAYLAWNIDRSLAALGFSPGDRMPARVHLDLIHEELPPVLAIVTPSYSFLLANSGNEFVQDGDLGITLPDSLPHDDSFPFVRTHQLPLQADRFDLQTILALTGFSELSLEDDSFSTDSALIKNLINQSLTFFI